MRCAWRELSYLNHVIPSFGRRQNSTRESRSAVGGTLKAGELYLYSLNSSSDPEARAESNTSDGALICVPGFSHKFESSSIVNNRITFVADGGRRPGLAGRELAAMGAII